MRPRHHLGIIDDFLDQTHTQRGFRVDRVAGQQHPHRLSDADKARQHLRCSAAAKPAARHFRAADPGAAPADADIGGDRDLHAAAQHPALQRGDHRLLDIAHQRRIFDAVAEGHEIRQVDQHIEIAASREGTLAGAADRHHANAAVNVDGAADAAAIPASFPA